MDFTSAFKAAVRHLTRRSKFYGFYEYRVLSEEPRETPTSEARLSVQIVSKVDGLDDQLLITKNHGSASLDEQCQPGSLVLVGFVAGHPARPYIAHYLRSTPIRAWIDSTTQITIGASLSVSGEVDLGPGPYQVVAIGPPVIQALQAVETFSLAVSVFATAVGGVVPALAGAAATLAAAQVSLSATLAPLLGGPPTGISAGYTRAS